MRFAPRSIPFGRKPASPDAASEEAVPAPLRVKLKARRAASIAEAREILAHLPEPGEGLHALVTRRLDLTDVLAHLLERFGPCEQMRIATLGYSRRSLRHMLQWLDSGAVASLGLVASLFFRSHNPELWSETQAEFRQRGQRAACCPSHAKVVAFSFANGEKLSLEGSANLVGSGSGREQFCLIRDDPLHCFHADWIGALIDRHEGRGPQ